MRRMIIAAAATAGLVLAGTGTAFADDFHHHVGDRCAREHGWFHWFHRYDNCGWNRYQFHFRGWFDHRGGFDHHGFGDHGFGHDGDHGDHHGAPGDHHDGGHDGDHHH